MDYKKVFTRDDYKRASTLLKETVVEMAEQVRLKMEELALPSLDVPGTYLQLDIRKVKSHSGFQCIFLALEISGHSLETLESHYFMGDFHCLVTRATDREFLDFANSFGKVLAKLTEVEDELTAEASNQEFFKLSESVEKEDGL